MRAGGRSTDQSCDPCSNYPAKAGQRTLRYRAAVARQGQSSSTAEACGRNEVRARQLVAPHWVLPLLVRA